MKVRQAKPKDKDYKLFDGKGLYLLVKKNGAKYWRMKYRYLGKEKLLAVGVNPQISLEQARTALDAARHTLNIEHTDSGTQKKLEKLIRHEQAKTEVARFF